MVDFWFICSNCSMDLTEEFFAFTLYRSPPDLENFIVEEGGSKSGSGDQGISHY